MEWSRYNMQALRLILFCFSRSFHWAYIHESSLFERAVYLLRITTNQIGFHCFFFFFFSVASIATAIDDFEDCIKFYIRLYYYCFMGICCVAGVASLLFIQALSSSFDHSTKPPAQNGGGSIFRYDTQCLLCI